MGMVGQHASACRSPIRRVSLRIHLDGILEERVSSRTRVAVLIEHFDCRFFATFGTKNVQDFNIPRCRAAEEKELKERFEGNLVPVLDAKEHSGVISLHIILSVRVVGQKRMQEVDAVVGPKLCSYLKYRPARVWISNKNAAVFLLVQSFDVRSIIILDGLKEQLKRQNG